jgi:transposase
MCYSLDLRKKVISFIENGNSITKAARIFGINRATVYRWLDKPNLERTESSEKAEENRYCQTESRCGEVPR